MVGDGAVGVRNDRHKTTRLLRRGGAAPGRVGLCVWAREAAQDVRAVSAGALEERHFRRGSCHVSAREAMLHTERPVRVRCCSRRASATAHPPVDCGRASRRPWYSGRPPTTKCTPSGSAATQRQLRARSRAPSRSTAPGACRSSCRSALRPAAPPPHLRARRLDGAPHARSRHMHRTELVMTRAAGRRRHAPHRCRSAQRASRPAENWIALFDARGDADARCTRRRARDVVREREADHDVLHHVRRQIAAERLRLRGREIWRETRRRRPRVARMARGLRWQLALSPRRPSGPARAGWARRSSTALSARVRRAADGVPADGPAHRLGGLCFAVLRACWRC